jgi:hypothetical protein
MPRIFPDDDTKPPFCDHLNCPRGIASFFAKNGYITPFSSFLLFALTKAADTCSGRLLKKKSAGAGYLLKKNCGLEEKALSLPKP